MVVKCAWMNCNHNTSNTKGMPGLCTKESIELRHIDNEDINCEYCDDIIEGLSCKDFEWKGVK